MSRRWERMLWIDTETGGLDDRKHDALSLAWGVTDPAGVWLTPPRELRFDPALPVDPGAAAVNGYNPETWDPLLYPSEPLRRFCEVSEGAILAGHNPGFDRPFVRNLLDRYRLLPLFRPDYHLIDTASLALPLLLDGSVPNLKLATLCRHFGIPHYAPGEPHRAARDVYAAVEVYRRLWSMR